MVDQTLLAQIREILIQNRDQIIGQWANGMVREMQNVVKRIGESKLLDWSENLFDLLVQGLVAGDDIQSESYAGLREHIQRLSKECSVKNLSVSETAFFIFGLKDAMLPVFRQCCPDRDQFQSALTTTNRMMDRLGILTFETYVASRDDKIREQQLSLMETAAPVVRVWDKILMLPLIGILDSQRTLMVMEKMLSAIEETQSKVVILDITGIPTVDTLVARHLIRAATAVRLMGAECIITGISARIAQTIVQMGIDLEGLQTRSVMADGLKEAFHRIGLQILPLTRESSHE